MNLKYITLLFVLFLSGAMSAQTLQLRFCGKTSNVTPKNDGNGNDQRHKGGIRLDHIRVGLNGMSKTNPFYQLGINGQSFTFKNDIQVDGCNANGNANACTGCTTCKNIVDVNNTTVATTLGKMIDNVRVRTNGNALYIESTGSQNVVCIETTPINVRAHGGKRLEFNFGYEGTESDGFTTFNVNAEYRYNNNSWVNTLNQNSNFLRLIDTAIFVPVPVPAVQNLDHIIQFSVLPNPVQDDLFIEFSSNESLDAQIEIIDETSRIVHQEPWFISSGNGNKKVNVSALPQGFYILQIADKQNRVSFKKFIK